MCIRDRDQTAADAGYKRKTHPLPSIGHHAIWRMNMIQLKNRPFAGKEPTTTQQAEFSLSLIHILLCPLKYLVSYIFRLPTCSVVSLNFVEHTNFVFYSLHFITPDWISSVSYTNLKNSKNEFVATIAKKAWPDEERTGRRH